MAEVSPPREAREARAVGIAGTELAGYCRARLAAFKLPGSYRVAPAEQRKD